MAIDLDPGYPDQLWVKDSRFENITGPAVLISLEQSPLTEIGFENAILRNVPTFAKLRESGKTVPGKGALYQVKTFNYGLIVPGEGQMGAIGMQYESVPLASMPAAFHRPSAPFHPAANGLTYTRSA